MNNHLVQLLKKWHPERDTRLWVLATVYKTIGPSYRKAGAMMLFNDLGQHYGLLSGGCLEADIQRQASRVMRSKRSLTVCYDGRDEDDIAFQLGIGCGGTVHILLQPILPELNYLDLGTVYRDLSDGGHGLYCQQIDEDAAVKNTWQTSPPVHRDGGANLVTKGSEIWLQTVLKPPPHLLLVGGGVDAQPLVALAVTLGWQVSLWDSRPANARREYFLAATNILREPIESLHDNPTLATCDAAIVMSHNLQMDAAAINLLQKSNVKYLALLGPTTRKQQVLQLAQLTEQTLAIPIAGPAGLDLGGELPEAIALSILAECHARLQRASGQSLSGILNTDLP
jgi:xanthine dehydrogenase accessory factor